MTRNQAVSLGHGVIAAWVCKFAGVLLVAWPALLLVLPYSFPVEPKLIWFVSVIGFGLIALGCFGSQKSWLYGGLVFSLFVGGGAQLWLTKPLWYPSITLNPAGGLAIPMLIIVISQALFALIVHLRAPRHYPIPVWIESFGIARTFLFLGLSAAFSVSIMGFIPNNNYQSYVEKLFVATTFLGVCLLTVTAMFRLPRPAHSLRNVPVMLPVAIAIMASAALSWFAFEAFPHVEDEVAFLFQARTFAGGSLWVPAPPEAAREALDFYLLHVSGDRWIGTPPPGWPLVLTIGVLFSVPWLINPLLAGLSVALAHSIIQNIAKRSKADLAALLMCCSPWFLASSASMMPHLISLTCMLLGWRLLLIKPESARQNLCVALLGGLSIGWVFVTRQLDGVIVGVATGLWLLSKWRNDQGPARVFLYSVGCLAAGSIYLFYNAAITGDPLVSPLDVYLTSSWAEGANSYGFGPAMGSPDGWQNLDLFAGHSPFEGMINTIQNLSGVHLELFGWGIGSICLVWYLFVWGLPDHTDFAMAALAIVLMVAMALYWFSGSYYIGPRYWFSMLFPIIYLSASGFQSLSSKLQELGCSRGSVDTTLMVLCAFSLIIFTPWRGVEKYHEYQGFQAETRAEMIEGDFGNAIVFFESGDHLGSFLVLNDPRLPDNRPIFARDFGPYKNEGLIATFPNRPVIYYKKDATQ